MKSRLDKKFEDENYSIYVFKPSIINPFYGKLRSIDLRQRLKYLVSLIQGYRVYHLFKGNAEIGYCVISKGGSFRYPFTTKDDVIVGPYFISKDYRGKRLSIFLVNKCLTEFEQNYINAFDFIQANNEVSIKTTLSSGFKYYSQGEYSKFLRVLRTRDKGNFTIFRYTNFKE